MSNCTATTATGEQCRRNRTIGTYCTQHHKLIVGTPISLPETKRSLESHRTIGPLRVPVLVPKKTDLDIDDLIHQVKSLQVHKDREDLIKDDLTWFETFIELYNELITTCKKGLKK